MKRTLKFYLVYLFFYFPLSLRIEPLTSPLHLSLSFATLVASVHDETRGPNFPFWWSSSRFLLDSLFFFYHLVSMRWLLLLLLKFQIIWFLYYIQWSTLAYCHKIWEWDLYEKGIYMKNGLLNILFPLVLFTGFKNI